MDGQTIVTLSATVTLIYAIWYFNKIDKITLMTSNKFCNEMSIDV